MDPLSASIFALILITFTSHGTNANCVFELDPPFPKTIVHFGSKHFLRETSIGRTAETNDKFDLYCKNGFHSSNYGFINEQRIELKCVGSLFRTYIEGYGDVDPRRLYCGSSESNEMYESVTKLPDCENEMTLVVGDDFKELGSLKNLAICFDILKAKVKYVAYTAYPSKMKIIEKTQVGQLDRLGLDIDVSSTNNMFNAISTSDILRALKKDKQLKQLFGDETYEYANLIQDNAFKDEFDASSSVVKMLSIVWLRALRSGHWRHMLDALQLANLNGKYDVRVGISGVVTLPMLQHCNETQQMILELENGDTVTVPSHIWAHIRSLQEKSASMSNNATDEFVVVAHNSPFVTNDQKQELCNSMCHEIDWLKDSLFMKLQHYPIYGSVQCCRVADVADKLDNFPKSNGLPPLPPLPPPAPFPHSTTTTTPDPELLNYDD